MSIIGTDLESAVLAIVQSITFTSVDPANILARALPLNGETLDHLPTIILAAADEPEERKPLSFEDDWELYYPFEICRIDASNRDYLVKPLAREFKQLIRKAFGVTLVILNVWDTPEVKIGHLFDRDTLAQQYTYSSCVVAFRSQEQGG